VLKLGSQEKENHESTNSFYNYSWIRGQYRNFIVTSSF
jgi:hypothetical protein